MAQKTQANVGYNAQTPQPPIFGQTQQPPSVGQPNNTEALLNLISLLRGGGGIPQGAGLGNIMGGKMGGGGAGGMGGGGLGGIR